MAGIDAAALSLQLLGGCIKGFVLLSTAWNMEKHGASLVCSLNLEEVRLIEWAKRAGLLDEDAEPSDRLNLDLVDRTLQQLQDLMLDTDKLERRYKLKLIERPDIALGSVNGAVGGETEPDGFIGRNLLDQTRKMILSKAGLISETTQMLPRRLWWAAIDKQRFQDLVREINSFITQLWNIMDGLQQDEILQNVNRTLESVVKFDEKLDQLLDLRDAIRIFTRPRQEQRRTSILDSHEIACAAEIKALRIQDEAAAAVDKRGYVMDRSLDSNYSELVNRLQQRGGKVRTLARETLKAVGQITSRYRDSERQTMLYDGRAVLVEWKRLDGPLGRRLYSRVVNLAALLRGPNSAYFLAPSCLGIVEETQPPRMGLVFEHPRQQNAAAEPLTLRDAMSLKLDLLPSVSDRLAVALRLTKAVRLLHVAGWYHKDLRAENVLFFPPAEVKQASSQDLLELLGEPFIGGFAWAREATPLAISEQPSAEPGRDIYRHPDAVGTPQEAFSADKDMYSLGLVLTEVARWTPLQAILHNEKVFDFKAKTVWETELAKVRPYMLDELEGSRGRNLEKVGFRMGAKYREVVMQCLAGPREASDEAGISPLDAAIEALAKASI